MQTIASTVPPRRILRKRSVLALLDGIHYTTVYRWELAGEFPRRVQLGANCVGWYEDEVRDWLASRQRPQHGDRPSPNPKATRRTPQGGRG